MPPRSALRRLNTGQETRCRIDTARFSVIAAVETPTGDDAFSSDSFDPVVGGVFTYIKGRHGFDAALRWEFNTGETPQPVRGGMGSANVLFYDAAYLFRVSPAAFGAGPNAALYAIIEANGLYETNGDNEVLLSPGIMYEARNFASELSVQLPVWQEIESRPKTEFTVTAGLRWLF
jgi:hypothetical protein